MKSLEVNKFIEIGELLIGDRFVFSDAQMNLFKFQWPSCYHELSQSSITFRAVDRRIVKEDPSWNQIGFIIEGNENKVYYTGTTKMVLLLEKEEMNKENNNPIVLENDTKEWYNERGLLHREDGPAVIYSNGDKEWWQNGKLHRLDGPACEYNRYEAWYFEDKRHRLDGPAVIFANGDKEWWEHDRLIKKVTQEGMFKYGTISDEPTTTRIHDQVKAFHIAGECPIKTVPEVPSSDRVRLRARLTTEEYMEMLQSLWSGDEEKKQELDWIKTEIYNLLDQENFNVDIVAFTDAAADLDYVNEGARLEFGVNGLPVMDEVQKTNMAKFGPGSWKDENGKVRKPPDWQPPDIAGKLREQGWRG